ncbi:MAG: tetratricopeptide repeat protein [bacterium]|nr:tetratricopeptide repeat protein [bacterium]
MRDVKGAEKEPGKRIPGIDRAVWKTVLDRLTASALAVAFAMGLVFATPVTGAAFRNLTKGGPVPDFTLKDLEGMDRTLSAEKGKVVVLGFVKPDQDRSIKVLNALEEVSGTLLNDGVTVWVVSAKAEDPAAIKTLVEKMSLQYPILVDEDQKLYGEYGLFTFPVTAIIDQEGSFVFDYSSYSGDYTETIVNEARMLLGLISREELEKSSEKTEIVEKSKEEKEADRALQMGKVLLERGFGTKALPKFEQALALNPSLVEGRLLSGEIYLKEEQYDKAREQFEKVFEVEASSNEARIGMASVFIAEGKFDEAEEQLQKAIALNPDPTLALYRLGQIYEKKSDVQKAMETYRNALERVLKKSGK